MADTYYSKIKRMCSEKGCSVAYIERKAGLNPNTVYKWEKHEPTAKNLKAVADALEMPIDYFLR